MPYIYRGYCSVLFWIGQLFARQGRDQCRVFSFSPSRPRFGDSAFYRRTMAAVVVVACTGLARGVLICAID